MFNSTTINGNLVTFEVKEGVVSFQVNESFDKKDLESGKVAITKWLLNQFKAAQSEYTELCCAAHSQDGYGEMRDKIHKKLGFKQYDLSLIWCAEGHTPKQIKREVVELEDLDFSC